MGRVTGGLEGQRVRYGYSGRGVYLMGVRIGVVSCCVAQVFGGGLGLKIVLFVFTAPVLSMLGTLVSIDGKTTIPFPTLTTFLKSFVAAKLRNILAKCLPLFLTVVITSSYVRSCEVKCGGVLIAGENGGGCFTLGVLGDFAISFLVLMVPLLLGLLVIRVIFTNNAFLFVSPRSVGMVPDVTRRFDRPVFCGLLYVFLFSFLNTFIKDNTATLTVTFPGEFVLCPLSFVL